ncbi:MAG: flagellar biosynthesis protein FlhF, partial [Aquabacterium sp.]
MNVKRFTARTSRDALMLVRRSLGDDAVILSTRPGTEGVEVLAMASDGMHALERAATATPRIGAEDMAAPPAATARAAAPNMAALAVPSGRGPAPRPPRVEPRLSAEATEAQVSQDVATLSMSTLSFQDYVRERMLKRRRAEMQAQQPPHQAPATTSEATAAAVPHPAVPHPAMPAPAAPRPAFATTTAAAAAPLPAREAILVRAGRPLREPPLLSDELALGHAGAADGGERGRQEVMAELRAVRGLIEERFGALAYMEKLQREPPLLSDELALGHAGAADGGERGRQEVMAEL